MEVPCIFPSVILVGVSLPFDLVLQLSSARFSSEFSGFVYLVFFFYINRAWFDNGSPSELVIIVYDEWFEERGVEVVVNLV